MSQIQVYNSNFLRDTKKIGNFAVQLSGSHTGQFVGGNLTLIGIHTFVYNSLLNTTTLYLKTANISFPCSFNSTTIIQDNSNIQFNFPLSPNSVSVTNSKLYVNANVTTNSFSILVKKWVRLELICRILGSFQC